MKLTFPSRWSILEYHSLIGNELKIMDLCHLILMVKISSNESSLGHMVTQNSFCLVSKIIQILKKQYSDSSLWKKLWNVILHQKIYISAWNFLKWENRISELQKISFSLCTHGLQNIDMALEACVSFRIREFQTWIILSCHSDILSNKIK